MLSQYTRRIQWFELALTFLGACILLFIVAPLVSMVFATTIGDLSKTAADQEVIQSIKITLLAALFAMAVSLLSPILRQELPYSRSSAEILLLAGCLAGD